jgi:hypothetical protein
MPNTHELKCRWQYFDAILAGDKTFEVRKDDRAFQRGDILELTRTDFTGRIEYYPGTESPHEIPKIRLEITYVYNGGAGGLQPGYVVLGLKWLDGGS